MKDASFTIEVTSHILANGMGPDGTPDTFQRDSRSHIVFQQSWFHSAYCQAIELSHMRGVKAGDIHMDLSFKADTEMYNRRYGPEQFRVHEAIMPGSRVTFKAVVGDHITEQGLRILLERIGTYIGLSPYGFKLGFGKFTVIDVTVAPSDAAQP